MDSGARLWQSLPPRMVLFVPPEQGHLSQPVPVSLKCLISILLELFSVLSLGMFSRVAAW